jgi:ACS family pantothenate transporter-like MFS transporter
VSTQLLETTLNRFPTGTEDFVSHTVLGNYIQDTAVRTGVHEVTRYDTDVRGVSKSGKSWNINTATLFKNEDGTYTKNSASEVRYMSI